MKRTYTINTYVDCGALGIVDAVCKVEYIPAQPARTSGPPEACCPAEDDEAEIIEAFAIFGEQRLPVDLCESTQEVDDLNERMLDECRTLYEDEQAEAAEQERDDSPDITDQWPYPESPLSPR